MVQVITVAPTQGGWSVQHDVIGAAMMFKSGAKAEAAAKALAGSLAQSGVWTEVHIYLRDGSLGGRMTCAPRYEAMAS